MRELINDPFYELIEAYDRCVIDYCIIEADIPHQGYHSHKKAIEFAMGKLNERYIDDELSVWSIDIDKANAEGIDSATLIDNPDIREKNGQVSYRYAFLEPPYGTGYDKADFDKINDMLFPNGVEPLEIYEWTTDWSDYFDAGHEWWGAACWSVYDKSMNRYVVIMVSATD